MFVRLSLRVLSAGCGLLLLAAGPSSAKPLLPQVVSGNAAPRASADDAEAERSLAEPQFDTTTTPLPPNVPSLGFHITATSEFGDLIRLDGMAHFIDSVTVTMSSWAIHSDYPGSSPVGFTHPITLKLYDVDRTSGRPRPGRLMAAVTTPFLIPWRPEPHYTMANSSLRPWRAQDGNYYGGVAFNLTFDLNALSIALPEDVIFSISFNTQDHGETPLGIEGPYNSLSVGVSPRPPSPGTDLGTGAVYWKTADGTFYTDRGAEGTDVFRLDTGWGGYVPAIRFNNSPYGSLADIATRLMDWDSPRADVADALREARKMAAAALERQLWENNRQIRGTWDRLVFDLLAVTADELTVVARSRDPLAPAAQKAVDTLVTIAQSMAETALGDAIIGGGDATRLAHAQSALDDAAKALAGARPDLSIDELGTAWREALLSLR